MPSLKVLHAIIVLLRPAFKNHRPMRPGESLEQEDVTLAKEEEDQVGQ